MIKKLLFPQALRWARKGFLAILDQGLFSGANFLVNILLARWLLPEEYGAFAVALSVFYLLAGFHTAVLTEPMMVFGAGKHREHFRKYLGMLLYGHWGISAIVALALGIAALVFARYGSLSMARALAGLAVASPFLLLLWLVRRACYVPMQPIWATVGSGINLAVTLVGLLLLWRIKILSSLSGLVLLGIAAGLTSVFLSSRLQPQVVDLSGNPTSAMVLADHWEYGRWLLLNSLVFWVFAESVTPILMALHGLAVVGIYRAYHILTTPLFHSLNALGLLVVPTAGRTYYERGQAALRKIAVSFTMPCFLMASVYGLVISAMRQPLVSFLLGEAYLPHADLVLVWSVGMIILSLSRGAEVAMRAMGRTQFIFYSYVAGSGAAIGLFMVLIPHWGLWGAAWATLLSFVVQTVVLLGYSLKELRSNHHPGR